MVLLPESSGVPRTFSRILIGPRFLPHSFAYLTLPLLIISLLDQAMMLGPSSSAEVTAAVGAGRCILPFRKWVRKLINSTCCRIWMSCFVASRGTRSATSSFRAR